MKKSFWVNGAAAIGFFLFGYGYAAGEDFSLFEPTSSQAVSDLSSLREVGDEEVAQSHTLQIEPDQKSLREGSQSEIPRLIKEGEHFLADKNWQDAKIYYEKALKKYPENGDIRSAYLLSRTHYEVENRYRDGSFCQFLASTNKEEILGLCDDVLKNIQTWYVDAPDWNHLFAYGMNSLKIALTEEAFLRQNRVPVEYDSRLPEYGDALIKYVSQWDIQTREDLRGRILQIAESVQRNTNISGISVIMEILCGMVNSLDSYSAYLTSGQINDLYSMIDGHFVGLGVYIESKWQDDALLISKVIPHSPAANAGLASGDLIFEIDGRPVIETGSPEEAGELLQGEEGSKVTLTVKSKGKSPRQMTIFRKSFDIPSVEDAKYLPSPQNRHILFFRISAFQKATVDEVKAELARFEKTGIDCLIIDLRNNPGGLLDKAVELSDLFLDSGTIVRTKGRTNDHTESADPAVLCRAPMILLIDENSASAAEIFAGAIQENGRGQVIGTRSFGKGTVQVIVQLGSLQSDELIAGLRLTTEKFYSPRGRSYSGVGVIPDIDISNMYAAARPESARAVSLEQMNTPQKEKSEPVADICLSRALKETELILSK